MQWKYRKRMLICDDVFNEIIISNAQAKALFKKYKKALFIRYTTEVDRTDSTEWYCCIKDDRYDFECLKSKRKNVIRKGLSNFSVREVKLSAGAEFIVVLTGAIMTMPGLPKKPAAFSIDVDDDGNITGLF